MDKKSILKAIVGVGLIIGLAIVLRIYNLASLPVFADEAIYIRWAQIMRNEPSLRFIPLTDGKQPLFMWSIVPALKFIEDPLLAGRAISVITGLGTLVGVMVTAFFLVSRFQRERFNRALNVSMAAGLLYAISPYTVFFDRLALADSMLSMFGIWFFVLFYAAVYFVRLDLAMIAGFALGGAFLTKSPALFMALMSPSLWTLARWPQVNRKLHALKLAALTTMSVGISYAMYNILRLGPNFHLLTARTKDYVYPLSHIIEKTWDPFLPYFDRAIEYYQILGPTPVLILGALSIILLFSSRKPMLLVTVFWFITPVLIVSMFSKTMTARYIYYSFPFLIILASLWIDSEKVRTVFVNSKYRVVRNFIIISLLILMGGTLSRTSTIITDIEAAHIPRSERSGYLEEWTSGTGIVEIARVLRDLQRQNPDGKIVVGTEGYFGTLPDALQMYLADTPEITVIGVGLDFTKVPIQLTESSEFGNRTYLVVNSSRLKISEEEFETFGYRIVEKYQKADRPDNIREYVQHGLHDYLYLLEII